MSELVFSCPTLHAESLHVDTVWRAVQLAMTRLERQGGRFTFFVFPYRAVASGSDITERLREISARGHEIAQHTHFYDRVGGVGPQKRTDVGAENVIECLERDYSYLMASGVRPAGFVAGGWVIADAAFQWLEHRRFAYDCSYRSFELRYSNPPGARGEAAGPFWKGSVLEMPTTATLAVALRSRGRFRVRGLPGGTARYELYYLHDDDLVDRRKMFALGIIERVTARSRFATAGELARSISPSIQRV